MLPRIPKIKRENSSVVHGSTGSNSNNLPESSMTSLAGDKGRQSSVDQQGARESRQGRPIDGQRQRLDRAVPSSSFSNSFSTPSTSASVPSNSQPSSSTAISFRISSSGNPWHARRLSAPDQALPAKDKAPVKRNQKDKQQMLLSSYSQAKKTSVESEVYDPFNPTGSDASDSEDENEDDKAEINLPSSPATVQTVGQNEDAELQIKTESMDLDLPADNEMSGMKVQVKKEPTSPKDDSWSSPSHHPATLFAAQSQSLAALVAYSGSPVVSDAEDSGNSEGHLVKSPDHSRSSSLSSHHSEEKVKIEIKSEPDLEPSPVIDTSLVVSQVTKGNGIIQELSSVSGSSEANHKSKEKEIRSPCASSGEERRSWCASNSPPFKASEQSDKQKKPSRSEDRRRSRSRSPRRRRSRSRSRERSHLRDRRRSTRSSSSESSRKRRRKHENRDRYDSREKEVQKRSKKKRYSHSRSRSRTRSRSRSKSRERRRERTFSHRSSSRSRDSNETRSKRKRSRSASRDPRRRENVSEGPRRRERHSDKSSSAEEKEPTHSIERNAVLMKKESQTGQNECDTTLSAVSTEKETDSSNQENSQLIEETSKQLSEDVLSISLSHKSHESKPIEIKEEKDSSLSKNKESQLLKDQLPKQLKVEQIWPNDDDDDEDSCSDDDVLVINLSSPGPTPTDCEKMTDSDSTSLSVVPKEEMEVEPLQASCPVKQEPVDSSDEEINVDYLIDNLDFIKKEMKDEPVTNAAGAVEPQADMGKESAMVKQEMESVLVMAGTKAKSQGKRVTWNIQEPVVSQPDKMSSEYIII